MHLLTYPYGLSLSSCQYFKFQQSKTIRGPVALEALQKLKFINYCWRSIVMSQKRIAISKPLRNLGKEGLPVKYDWWWFSIANFFLWETNEPPRLGLGLGLGLGPWLPQHMHVALHFSFWRNAALMTFLLPCSMVKIVSKLASWN